MTLPELDQLYGKLDNVIRQALSSERVSPPCCKGCFHCCREPVYATSQEVQGILDSLTLEQRQDLSVKVLPWRDRFIDNGFHTHVYVPVDLYRAQNVWCPLLNVDGSCSVYSRRPCACRMHIAKETPEKCEKDELRLRQVFLHVQGLGEAVNQSVLNKMNDGEVLVYEHLGLLLFEALHGEKTDTVSRAEVRVQGDDLIIETHEPDTRT